jgi:pantoate--beta-alanine ligase
MHIITTVAQMQAERERMAGSVALVPTMGYLHEGHLSLVRRALNDCDNVVVSIFVNPTQFGPREDFARYPRDEKRDLQLLSASRVPPLPHTGEGSGVRTVFAPSVEEIYPAGFDDWIEVGGPLTERLEGAHRPGHFRGVTAVVARLFRIIEPQRAYFGQKDAQQLRVIRRMVEEQSLPVEIILMPTVREPDGLAMSSRNVYLSPQERQAALALPRALALARRLVMEEGITNVEAVRSTIALPARPEALVERAERPPLALDYVSVSDEHTLEELDIIDRPALVLLAARAGATRLIDNTVVVPKGVPVPHHLRPLIDADAAALPTSDL